VKARHLLQHASIYFALEGDPALFKLCFKHLIRLSWAPARLSFAFTDHIAGGHDANHLFWLGIDRDHMCEVFCVCNLVQSLCSNFVLVVPLLGFRVD
jgi:hypothetical protein